MFKKLINNIFGSTELEAKFNEDELNELSFIDHQKAIALLMDNKDVYVNTINQFFDLVDNIIIEFEDDLKSGNSVEAERKIHSLKGVMGILGAFNMVPFVQSMEKEIKESQLKQENLDKFKEVIKRLKVNLNNILIDIKEGKI